MGVTSRDSYYIIPCSKVKRKISKRLKCKHILYDKDKSQKLERNEDNESPKTK